MSNRRSIHDPRRAKWRLSTHCGPSSVHQINETYSYGPRDYCLTTFYSQSPECSCHIDVLARCCCAYSHDDPDDRISWSQHCGYGSQCQSHSKTTVALVVGFSHTPQGFYLVAFEPGCLGSLRRGQSHRAMVVNVVSRELESVLVEQNHCHGLDKVKKS